jgi:hypothetical protein
LLYNFIKFLFLNLIKLPSLCLPQLPLPCPPPSCGCCGRKKRETGVVSVGTKMGIKRIGEERSHCNNPYIRAIILKVKK